MGGWLLALAAFVAVSAGAGSSFNTNLSLPNTDSQSAVHLLTANFAAASGEGDQVVIQTTHGTTVTSPAIRSAVTAALTKVENVQGVASVASPYAPAGSSQISRDDTVAFARVTWDKLAAKVSKADAQNRSRPHDRPTGRTSLSPSAASRSRTRNGPASASPWSSACSPLSWFCCSSSAAPSWPR